MKIFLRNFNAIRQNCDAHGISQQQKKIHIGQKKRANFGIFALDFLNFAHSFGVVLSHIAISFVKSIIYANKTS